LRQPRPLRQRLQLRLSRPFRLESLGCLGFPAHPLHLLILLRLSRPLRLLRLRMLVLGIA
jgi:hypothetical protein